MAKRKQTNNADIADGKTLQIDIVKRFMTDDEWYAFRKEYWENRHTQQSRDRSANLGREVSSEEMEMLLAYIQDTDISYKELKKRFRGKDIAYQAGRAAVRILYQRQELLQRI